MVRIGNKRIVLLIISLFIVSCIAQVENVNSSEEQPFEWVAYPMYISPFAGSSVPIGYSPSQIRTAYGLPSSGGAGTTIAIIDAYDTPNILNYFNTFSNQYGLSDNSSGNFLVHKMAQNIQTDSNWALETCLDVEWAHAIAPDAKILLVESVSASNAALISAIDYATSQPGVVAVSMSWGGVEFSNENNFYYNSHFNKIGITFFASSGDDGSSVMWPAVLPNVVSVGGTTLDLNTDGTVISETAWQNSSGGLSAYVLRPAYQTNFGLNYSNRAVPDVSFNGNASTGVSVYNGAWWKVGGTSAGAPQWAAIQALGLSVTNTNLYGKAKLAYDSYFRDITSGINNVNSAVAGYDLVTGLGSPLTTNFGAKVSLSPTSGPPAGEITISGEGFTEGSSVNISYLNPVTQVWIPIISNLTTASQAFTYNMNVPDLLQNNIAGDHQAIQDSIVFRVQDNSNNRSYSTVPYAEGRRGLSQISNAAAIGLFGNNSDLASTVFVQNGESIVISGSWFSPGTASLLWDDTVNVGTAVIDGNGLFNANLQVPTTTAGQHRLTINNNDSNFCIILTRLPTLTNDYLDGWHTSDFTINLAPDYGMNETFYKLNNGPIFNVSANGQPTITTEGNNSTLEYWSIWDVYGTGLNELPHVTLTGIKLDKTLPTGTITTGTTTTQTPIITINLSATDTTSGIAQMSFSNDNTTWSNWEPYATSKTWILQDGDGQKTVSVQFMDNAGLTSTYSYTLTLETPQLPTTPAIIPSATPISTATPALTSTATPPPTSTSSPSPLPTTTPLQSPTPNMTNAPSPSDTQTPISQQLSESLGLILIAFVLSTITLALLFRKRRE